MLDISYVRDNVARVKEFSKQKGYKVNVDEVVDLDDRRKNLQQAIDRLRGQRNQIADEAGNRPGKPSGELVERGKRIKEELSGLEEELDFIEREFYRVLKTIPNIPAEDVPVGSSEDENVVTEYVGEKPDFDFTPLNHWEIGQQRDWIDKERAAKVAGSRFAYIKNDMVKLEFAIIRLATDILSDEAKIKEIASKAGLKNVSTKPFMPILPPLMIKTELYDAMDRLQPQDDRYKLEDEDLWLQGSAEHVLGSMYADEILNESELPLRMLGFATSFRKEAGTYGKDMEGILRVHQFDKLEMESFTTAEAGMEEHLLFVAIQRHLLELLEIPYRVVLKCTADIGKPNARGVDMEAWLPGQDKYRETHTADYMTDYQSRRLKTRVRRETGDIELVHTNDATAFALGRTMIAVIENGQTQDGKVRLPKILQEYLGKEEI
ncbi:MAG: serine--tRNA ligase [Candidatus Nomurabacteria bacterium]|jgi:seryl-tRNA synthetase|nr:serine--tRNA ligase [Candidatus Nomurabacteria bacterium]